MGDLRNCNVTCVAVDNVGIHFLAEMDGADVFHLPELQPSPRPIAADSDQWNETHASAHTPIVIDNGVSFICRSSISLTISVPRFGKVQPHSAMDGRRLPNLLFHRISCQSTETSGRTSPSSFSAMRSTSIPRPEHRQSPLGKETI